MKVAFWASALLVAYTFVGYGCWLMVCQLWRRVPVRRERYTPAVSVIMVVRNEEQTLECKLANLRALDYPADRLQIIVVSDGSTDGTEAILRKHARDERIQVVLNQLPNGKASGLNNALELADGEIVVFTDARQRIEDDAVRLLVENFADPDVGCASGELMLGDNANGESNRGMGLYWQVEKQVRGLEAATGSVVGATGALYAARRELLTNLPPGTILDDVLIPMQVARRGKRVVFDDRARAWDSADLGAGREFQRKVRTLTGNYQLLQLEPWLLTGENPLRFRFVSHKLLRLLVPFALATMLVTSLLIPEPAYRVAFCLQLFFYALSLLALTDAHLGPLARIANAALTLIVLNTAAVVAFANFLSGRKGVWAR